MWSAGITAIISLLPLFGTSLPGYNLGNFADVFLVLALGFGVKKKSRVCALVLFVYFVADKILSIVESPKLSTSNPLMAIIFFMFYLNGIRGTFAYHKFNKSVINRKISHS